MNKKVKYNGEFEKIDSPEKAYVLGLIYSDGCVCHNNSSYSHSIVLHNDDMELLEKIQKLFPFYTLRKHTNTSHGLYCNVKQCYYDLLNNGVLPKKSTENKDDFVLPKLSKELYSHFIRGYFDGDGSVYKQKLGNTKFEIGSTSFKLITEIIKILYDNRVTVNLRCKYVGTALRKNDFYILYASSDKISKQFAEFIYENCSDLYLKRKYEKLYYIPVYNIRERLICPYCGSNETTYMGTRGTKSNLTGKVQRGYCKRCNKRFTIKLTAPLDSNVQSGEGELLEG